MTKMAPVVLFVYNRPVHTKNTLEALNKCVYADETDLFIFCDNYKKDTDKESVEKVRKIVDEFVQRSDFNSVVVKKAEYNMGLAKSVIEGVSEVIDKYSASIVVEDDLLASKFFLRFMNEAIDFYRKSADVWAISGYSFPLPSLQSYQHDIYYSGRACSWGWATWSDRWKTVDWDVTNYNHFKHNWFQRWSFGKWGADLPAMLDYQMNLNINSWAIKWCYSAYLQRKYTVYPKKTFIINCGIDGSGVHSQNCYTNKFDTHFDDEEEYQCIFENLKPNKTIQHEFAKKYSNGFVIDLKEQVKALLVRFHIWK